MQKMKFEDAESCLNLTVLSLQNKLTSDDCGYLKRMMETYAELRIEEHMQQTKQV